MFLLHNIWKSSGADTFGEFLQKYFNIFSSLLFSSDCLQVHVVFNQSKGGRQQRGTFIGLKKQIRGLAIPVPRQWGKYLANPKKKVWLELFSSACFISTIGL